jgi:AraC family transcriptional activator of mtrCDE
MLLERLLENLALSVDAFASCRVSPGWRLRLPALDSVTFHYALNGRGEIQGLSGGASELSSGALAVVPPRLVHGIQCGEGPHGEVGVRDGRWAPGSVPEHRAGPEHEGEIFVACGSVEVTYGQGLGLFDRLPDVLVVDLEDDPKVRLIFEGLLDEIRSGRPGSRAMATTLMSESLIHVFRRLCVLDECALPWLRALDDPDLAPAIDAILEHPELSHTVATLARTCYLSRSAFARRFREAFGLPPMRYLRDVRLRRAAHLLQHGPGLSVRTLAARVGFQSRSQFSRAFKDYFGRSPSDFVALG